MILQVIRILLMTGLAFIVALVLTPIVNRLLYKYRLGKQIRVSEQTPVYSKLHSHKAGTPTMGGIIIWLTVLGMALIFFVLSAIFDGVWNYLNFTDRAQTYLPIAAMFIAALIGLIDDLFGVLKIGPKGGGLKVRHKLAIYAVIAALGAWWFYFKLNWTILYVPFWEILKSVGGIFLFLCSLLSRPLFQPTRPTALTVFWAAFRFSRFAL